MRDMPNLDFVRSVAVISVVVEHTLLDLDIHRAGPFEVQFVGVLGVLVFFVLTSLVLMWSLERRPHTLDFYIRRFFRIYPLAWAAILAAIVFHAPVGGGSASPFAYTFTTKFHVLTQSVLLYPTYPLLLGPMWSLPYEVAMYVFLPALFFFVRKNFSLWPLLAIWVVVLLNSMVVPGTAHSLGVAAGYFLPGIMAYVAFGRWKPSLPAWLLPPCLAAVWLLFWYHFNFHHGWGFCLVVGLMLPLFRQFTSEWVRKPSHIVAKYSYGIYLTHPFALTLGLYVLRGHSLAVRLGVAAVPLVVLPVLAYHLLENPMIRFGSRIAARAEKRYEQHEMKELREVRAEGIAG